MNGTTGVVIVGGSLAGVTAAETLRAEGWTGSVTVVDAQKSPLYDRPPMSKAYLGGALSADRLLLRGSERVDALGATWELGCAAVSLDTEQRVVRLDDGRELAYQHLVIATGVSPVVPGFMQVPSAHTLRTLQDADRLRRHLDPARSLVIIGAGFIGLEVAATFRTAGAKVDVVEALPTPLFRQLGPSIGGVVQRLHEAHGVTFHLGRQAEEVEQQDREVIVRLDNGEAVTGDALLVAVGCAPATSWLGGSGIELDAGVVTDAYLNAAPNVHAVGDLVRWPHPLVGRLVRVEHWTNAVEQANYVAKRIVGTGGDEPFASVPYFWSDQYKLRFQAHGVIDAADSELELIDGDLESERFAAVYVSGGRATAAVGVNNPRQVLAGRRRVVAELAKQEVSS